MGIRTPRPQGCDRALDTAIMTSPDKRDPEVLARLDAVARRVLQKVLVLGANGFILAATSPFICAPKAAR